MQKNTIIYFEKDEVYTQSDAIIHILSRLGGIHRGFIIFKYLPKSFRDHLYKMIAKYRYRWFGIRNEAFRPGDNIKLRFIDYDENQG